MVSLELSCDLQQLLSYPTISNSNQRFLAESHTVEHTPCDRPSLCAMQGECATLNTRGTKLLVGSQDATTCVVAILACPVTQIVWVAHLDHPQLGSQDVQGLEAALQQMQQPQMYLLGGYCEPAGAGPRLAQSFLQLLRTVAPHTQLQLCCVADANTNPTNGAPCCCQLVLDTETWQPHPWLFADRGPEVTRRFVAQHCRSDPSRTLLPIWDLQHHQLLLPAFDPTVTSWSALNYERLLALPDGRFLRYMSTSPDHEPAWFVQDMRNMLQWLLAAQDPDSPERQAASSSSRHCLSDNNTWRRVEQQATGPAAAAGAGGGGGNAGAGVAAAAASLSAAAS